MRYCNILLKRGGISKEIPIKTVKVKGKTMKVKGKTIKVKGKTMKVEGICCIIQLVLLCVHMLRKGTRVC